MTRIGQIFLDIKTRLAEFTKGTSRSKQEVRDLGRTAAAAGREGSAGLRQMRTEGEGLAGTMQKVFFTLEGFRSAVRLVSNTVGQWVRESANQQRVTAALTTALQQQGIYSDQLLKTLQDYANERQRVTQFENEATEELLAQLVVMGVHQDSLTGATAVAQDLATVMGVALPTAGRALARALEGDIGMINRYIAGIDQAEFESASLQERIGILNRAVGGQAEAFGRTGAGAIEIFNNELADAQKNLGDVVMVFLDAVLPTLTSAVTWFAELETKVLAAGTAMTLLVGTLSLLAVGMLGPIGAVVGLAAALAALIAWYKTTQKEAEERIKQVAREKVGVDEFIESLDELSDKQLKLDIQEAERNLSRLDKQVGELTSELDEWLHGWRWSATLIAAPFYKLFDLFTEDDRWTLTVKRLHDTRAAVEAEAEAWRKRKEAAEKALDPTVKPGAELQTIRKLTDEEKERLDIIKKRIQLSEATREDLIRELQSLENQITDEKELLDIRIERRNLEKELRDEAEQRQREELSRENELARLRIDNIQDEFKRRREAILLEYQLAVEGAEDLFDDKIQLDQAIDELRKRAINELNELERERVENIGELQHRIDEIRAQNIENRWEREAELIRVNYRMQVAQAEQLFENEVQRQEYLNELLIQRDRQLQELRQQQHEEETANYRRITRDMIRSIGGEFSRMLRDVFGEADNIFTRLLRSWIDLLIQELMRVMAMQVVSSIFGVATGGAGGAGALMGGGGVTRPIRSGPGQWNLPSGAMPRISTLDEIRNVGNFLNTITVPTPTLADVAGGGGIVDQLIALREDLAAKDFQIIFRNLLSGQKLLREEMPKYDKINKGRTFD